MLESHNAWTNVRSTTCSNPADAALQIAGTPTFRQRNVATSGLLVAGEARVWIPVAVMIRPRVGSFVFSRAEVEPMYCDMARARAFGADAVVIVVLDTSGHMDAVLTHGPEARADDTPVRFHRAFDEVRDHAAALDVLIDAGVSRVLTPSGAATTRDGADTLAAVVHHAAGRIAIMAGRTVRGANARDLVRRSGVSEMHARSELDESRIHGIVVAVRADPPLL